MQVKVDMGDVEIKLGNSGMVLNVADNRGKHLGKLRIGQAMVEWCRGKTRMGNGRKLPLAKLVEALDEDHE